MTTAALRSTLSHMNLSTTDALADAAKELHQLCKREGLSWKVVPTAFHYADGTTVLAVVIELGVLGGGRSVRQELLAGRSLTRSLQRFTKRLDTWLKRRKPPGYQNVPYELMINRRVRRHG